MTEQQGADLLVAIADLNERLGGLGLLLGNVLMFLQACALLLVCVLFFQAVRRYV